MSETCFYYLDGYCCCGNICSKGKYGSREHEACETFQKFEDQLRKDAEVMNEESNT